MEICFWCRAGHTACPTNMSPVRWSYDCVGKTNKKKTEITETKKTRCPRVVSSIINCQEHDRSLEGNVAWKKKTRSRVKGCSTKQNDICNRTQITAPWIYLHYGTD